jgi:hypothetical protein
MEELIGNWLLNVGANWLFSQKCSQCFIWMVFTQLSVAGKQCAVHAFKSKFNVKDLSLKRQLLLVLVVIQKSSCSWLQLKYRD